MQYCDYPDAEGDNYWKSRVYADMGRPYFLEQPVDISEFREFIHVMRQATITPVAGEEFNKLRDLMLARGNDIPDYAMKAEAVPVPISAINSDNWLALCHDYRRRFTLEKLFRRFYVDYFLMELSDDGIIYSECRVKKLDSPNAFTDNVIMLCGKYIPVDVKLNINSETKLFEQLESYCNAEAIFTGRIKLSGSGMLHRHSVIVIDTEGIYLYDDLTRKLAIVNDLDSVRSIEDIRRIKLSMIHRVNNTPAK